MRVNSAKQIAKIKTINYNYKDRWAEASIGMNACAYNDTKTINSNVWLMK